MGVQQVHASALSDALLKIQNIQKDIAQLQARLKASVEGSTSPVLSVYTPYDITQTSAIVGMSVDSFGTPASTGPLKIYYGTSSHSSDFSVSIPLSQYSIYQYKLTSLTCSTKYYYYGSLGSSYSLDGTITTAACDNEVKAVIAGASALSIGYNTAVVGGSAYSVTPISDYGICYKLDNGTSSYVCISGGTTTTGTLAKMTLSNLTPSSLYTFHMYIVNTAGRWDGYENYFRTIADPSGSTSGGSLTPTNYSVPAVAIYWDAAEITANSASVWSYLNSDGYPLVTASDRGACFGTSPSPVNCVVSVTPKTSTGDPFYTKMTGLTPNTLYYYRAYAQNSAGKVYSTDRTFKTLAGAFEQNPLPNLIASSVENVATSYPARSATTFTGTITNSGTAATSGTFYNHFELKSSLNSSTSIINLSPVSLSSVLGNGASTKVSSGINFGEAANYSIRLCADQTSSVNNSGTIIESNETDNCGDWANFVVGEVASAPVNGVWSTWANSGSCVNNLQTQTRTCTNPAPSNGGTNCSGVATQQISCNSGLSNLWASRVENIPVSVTPTYALNTSFTFTGTITNSGGVATTGTTYNHLELAMGLNGSGSINSFPVSSTGLSSNGGSAKISYPIVLSNVGNYSARFCADQVSSSNKAGSIAESSETDNCGDWANFIVSDPSVSTCSISSFTSTPLVITKGDSATLKWTTNNCTTVSIQSIGGVDINGSVVVKPLTDTTYTLAAMNGSDPKYSSISLKVNQVGLDLNTIDYIYANKSSLDNKTATIDGYVYSGDINSEMIITNNSYLGMRSSNSMLGTIFSMKILPDNLRKLLINSYNNKASDWIKVQVSGVLHLITLPMNGSSGQSIYLDVSSLKIVSPTVICPTNVPSVSCPEYQTEIVKDANGCVVEFRCSSTLKSASVSSTSTDVSSDVAINRVLKRGTKGDDVKKLQQFLGVDADGIFGRGTAASVKAWQAKNGLAQDGLFGYHSRTMAGL